MKDKIRIKGFKKPKAGCTCCKLEYSQGSIFNGFTISLTKKYYPDSSSVIDIPFRELKNLKLVIEHILKNSDDKNKT